MSKLPCFPACLTSFVLLSAGVVTSPAVFSAEPGEWQVLFDGSSTDAFRNYKRDTVSDGWQVEEGALVRKEKGAGDIITKDQYGAFELQLEYRISKAGNSGVMFHVQETDGPPWRTGPEVQIQDNVDGYDPQKAGWLYQLYKPPQGTDGEIVDATKPAGEWNQLVLRIHPEGSSVSINGTEYYTFKKGSEEWDRRVAASKFKRFADFGKPTKGHICLQDHGNVVAYRNIKIRELPEK